MLDKIKEIIDKMNSRGIPAPMVRDPVSQIPSVTLTMVVVSFGMCVIGLIGKASGFLGGVDMSQAITLFGVAGGMYLGRRFQSGDKTVKFESVEGQSTEEKGE